MFLNQYVNALTIDSEFSDSSEGNTAVPLRVSDAPCLPKRTEFRSAWPIASRLCFSSTIAVWRDHTELLFALTEGALGGKILDLGDRSGKTPPLLPRHNHRVTLASPA